MSSSVCPLEKTFRDIGIISANSVVLIIFHLVLAWRVTLNRRMCENNLSHV